MAAVGLLPARIAAGRRDDPGKESLLDPRKGNIHFIKELWVSWLLLLAHEIS
ncbi:hypothetical protein [Polaromonas sp.]|jgi:hypothetical protein|uniref:hypothetical protein n=1 Tax=Polaromonas sp. TaxID=1869339 RepID=UPI001D79D87E|nr:hypothetical protein [Polaromonas sp.]MBT9475061.1 hypothetical protein [Polaromonas sp.]